MLHGKRSCFEAQKLVSRNLIGRLGLFEGFYISTLGIQEIDDFANVEQRPVRDDVWCGM